MKRLTIDLDKCEHVNDYNCTLCEMRMSGLLEKIKCKGAVEILPGAEEEVAAGLVAECPCGAMSLSEIKR